MASRIAFADAVYARGELDSAAIDLPGPENELAISLDRAGLAALTAAHALDLEVWIWGTRDGVPGWHFDCAVHVSGGAAVGAGGEVVTHSRVWGHWVPWRQVADRRIKLRLRTARVLRCAVQVEFVEGREPSPRLTPASVAFVQAGSTGATGVTGFTQSLTIAADADRLLMSFVGVDDNEGADPVVVSIFNTTETLSLGTAYVPDLPGGQDLHLSVLKRIAPTATTANLVITGLLTTHRCFFGWAVASGVDQTTPLGTAGTNGNNTGDTLTGTCTGVADGMAFGFGLCLRSSSPTISDGGGQTGRTETEGIDTRLAGSIATIPGSGAMDFSWTGAGGTSQLWGVVATPLNPAAAAAAAPYVPYPDAWGSVGWMESAWMAGRSASVSIPPQRDHVQDMMLLGV